MNESAIEIKNLTRRFGKKTAIDNVTLSVPNGTVFGLVGENGAGKTTLIKHVLGLLRAKSGSVSVFGKDPVVDPVGVLGEIGYLSEDRDLPDWMSVSELMIYTRAFYPNWDDDFAKELQQMFELDGGQKIKSLSRGQRARVGLLVAVAHRPSMLVLDEPSSGLDPIVRRDILAAIVRTVADEGRTVLFSSHLLDEVERVADHVAMMNQGQVVLYDRVDTIVASHRRLVVHLSEPCDTPPELTGSISCSGEGSEWTIICNGEADQLKQEVTAIGAQVVEDDAASLDDVFIARIQSGAQC